MKEQNTPNPISGWGMIFRDTRQFITRVMRGGFSEFTAENAQNALKKRAMHEIGRKIQIFMNTYQPREYHVLKVPMFGQEIKIKNPSNAITDEGKGTIANWNDLVEHARRVQNQKFLYEKRPQVDNKEALRTKQLDASAEILSIEIQRAQIEANISARIKAIDAQVTRKSQ